jgi:integration host factor subunit beta
MVKSQLIEIIADKQHMLSPKDVELGIKYLLDYMSDQLSKGNRIEIRGFGSFDLRYRPPREAHNPKTGEKVAALQRYIPHFKAGKELKARINHEGRPPLSQDEDTEEEHEDDAF